MMSPAPVCEIVPPSSAKEPAVARLIGPPKAGTAAPAATNNQIIFLRILLPFAIKELRYPKPATFCRCSSLPDPCSSHQPGGRWIVFDSGQQSGASLLGKPHPSFLRIGLTPGWVQAVTSSRYPRPLNPGFDAGDLRSVLRIAAALLELQWSNTVSP